MEYVGKNKTRDVVENTTNKFWCLLVNVAKHLNPQSTTSLTILSAFIIDDSLWGMEVSTKETNLSLVKSELSWYHQIVVNNDDMKSPLQWWKHHEKQFPTFAFLV
jgi:hypothetical protein